MGKKNWINWAEFAFGVWVLASPWILGYWKITSALWSQVVVGVLLMLLSLWEIVGTEDHDEQR
ncbi:MAG: hypothetical protein A2214_00750 [Candidatus Harrisonbacteria bacterium RIFOXYA1_FULL_48_8]|uniref:SPW repeat-containing integral membrane domain-containing protein n=1 Tax=Candidatus Harrisonbacteria bacterium RIFOXYA1_FULL_48_8 TaxID=1798411 RepID=A0A1G1ZUL1_9BACT|nr:MAG: hypothetical protein A2214_00750 [Candidatus Harrisonbacteria bacterium RIFOXYA1_FULL_48_8]